MCICAGGGAVRSVSPDGGDVSSGGSTLADVDADIASANALHAAVLAAGSEYLGDSPMFQDRVTSTRPTSALALIPGDFVRVITHNCVCRT